MNLKNYYYYYESALSSKFCQDIIDYGKKHKLKLGSVESDINLDINKNLKSKKNLNLQKERNSNVVFLQDSWIYKEIHPFINEANNRAGWNFQWDWSEPCQFTKYGVNQYYDWHCDSFTNTYGENYNLNWKNKIRKLSVTISLSEPDDFEGGDLEFDFRNSKTGNNKKLCKEIRPRGSIIVFPSFVWHRVTPVTKGTRYSLVVWNLGYPFK